jgi:hypothetical protein
MDVGVVMSRAVLADKLEDGRVRQRAVATWNTRRVPTRLTPGWTNRLYVACDGRWCGYFPLAGDVLWNRADVQAPYALIFDPRRWTPLFGLTVFGSVLPGIIVLAETGARRRVGLTLPPGRAEAF